MDTTIEQLILDELQEHRKELKGFRAEVSKWREEDKERIVKLEVTSKDISGNGQPGRMKEAEDAITSLQRDRYWIFGVAAGVSTVIAGAIELIRLKVGH